MKNCIQLLLLLVVLNLISSCGDKPSIRYFYSDGTEITNTSTIAIARKEFDSLYIRSEKSLLVRTSFQANIRLEKTLATAQTELITDLKDRRPKFAHLIDSLPPDHFYNLGIIVMENTSGKIVYQREPKNDNMSRFMEMGMSRRLLGLTLAMYKGYSADDSFEAYDPYEFTIYDESGKLVKEIRDGLIPIKELLWYESGGGFHKTPYQSYTYADWANLRARLDVEMFIPPISARKNYAIHTPFIDFVRVFALLHNDGIKVKSHCVLSVKDEEGTTLFTSKKSAHRAVSRYISEEMLKVLESNMTIGNGRTAKEELNLDDNCHTFSGQNATDSGWFLFSDGKITIGIINCGRGHIKLKNDYIRIMTGYEFRRPKYFLPVLKRILSEIN